MQRTRRLSLDGAANFRDLGGYPVPGGHTAWGKIFRSDSLHSLSEADHARLAALGVRTVVDLRQDSERARAPSPFLGHATVRYHHNPLQSEDPFSHTPPERLHVIDLAAFYRSMLAGSAATFAYLFGLLARPESYPLVFHCASGRDRAGVAAALVLLAAGVPRAHVIQDYLLTARFLEERVERLRERYHAHDVDPEPILRNLQACERYIAAALDLVEERCGDAARYLHQAGLTEDELAAFRAVFVVHDAPRRAP